jgi:hypothetical protein
VIRRAASETGSRASETDSQTFGVCVRTECRGLERDFSALRSLSMFMVKHSLGE